MKHHVISTQKFGQIHKPHFVMLLHQRSYQIPTLILLLLYFCQYFIFFSKYCHFPYTKDKLKTASYGKLFW